MCSWNSVESGVEPQNSSTYKQFEQYQSRNEDG